MIDVILNYIIFDEKLTVDSLTLVDKICLGIYLDNCLGIKVERMLLFVDQKYIYELLYVSIFIFISLLNYGKIFHVLYSLLFAPLRLFLVCYVPMI